MAHTFAKLPILFYSAPANTESFSEIAAYCSERVLS